MHSHVTRSETFSFLGFKRYRLSAQIHPTHDELAIITSHRLHRIEIFHDPFRDTLDADAAAAHERAKAHGLFVTRARDAARVCASEIHALFSTMRALRAFNITVADLLSGVTVTHRSLRAIGEIEQVLTECIDHIDRSVRAAQSYSDQTEDIFAPGTEDDGGIPPRDWTRAWRR